MVFFRRSKKFGPFRLTASNSGLSLSGGVTGARVSANTKGEVRRTLGIPGTGIRDTKRIVGGKGRSESAEPQQSGGSDPAPHEMEFTAVDATGDSRELLEGQADVARLQVVEAKNVPNAAARAGIRANDQGWARGIRRAVLVPRGGEYRVWLLVTPEDNPARFKNGDPPFRASDIGRLGVRDVRKYADLFAGRNVHAVVYLDVTADLDPIAEVRFKPALLAFPEKPADVEADDEAASPSLAADQAEDQAAPRNAEQRHEASLDLESEPVEEAVRESVTVPAGWYADPIGDSSYRYWDGEVWTANVSEGG